MGPPVAVGRGPRPRRPSPSRLPALAPGPLFPRLGLRPWAARLQACLSRLTSPETRSCSGGGSACKSTPDTARPLQSHYGSGPRGTENNGRDMPALRRAHWPSRTAPGNSAFLLASTAKEGGRLDPRHCGRCSSSRPPRLRAWEWSLGLITWAVPEDHRQKKSADWPSRPQCWPEL